MLRERYTLSVWKQGHLLLVVQIAPQAAIQISINSIGLSNIEAHVNELHRYTLDKLSKRNDSFVFLVKASLNASLSYDHLLSFLRI